MKIHACLLHDGKLVKSKKCVVFKHSVSKYESHKSNYNQTKGTADIKSVRANSTTKKSPTYKNPSLLSGEHYTHFALPYAMYEKKNQAVNKHSILIVVSGTINLKDLLNPDQIEEMAKLRISELKHVSAQGQCLISDQSTKAEYWKRSARRPRLDTQSSFLWTEAKTHGSSHIYQWLNVH